MSVFNTDLYVEYFRQFELKKKCCECELYYEVRQVTMTIIVYILTQSG